MCRVVFDRVHHDEGLPQRRRPAACRQTGPIAAALPRMLLARCAVRPPQRRQTPVLHSVWATSAVAQGDTHPSDARAALARTRWTCVGGIFNT
eukprot:1987075-Prymnesium_polylepis.1